MFCVLYVSLRTGFMRHEISFFIAISRKTDDMMFILLPFNQWHGIIDEKK